MRRVSPITKSKVAKPIQTRSLYIKRSQAIDMLREKSIHVHEAPTGSNTSLAITVDRTGLCPCITLALSAGGESPSKYLFDYNMSNFNETFPAITAMASQLGLSNTEQSKLAKLIESLWQIFKEKEAFSLETKIGLSSNGALEVYDARFGFDDAAFKSSGRQEAVHQLRDKASEVPEEVEAENDGIVYIK